MTPHVVILGAGFGGLAAAKDLGSAPVRVTVIDRRNHHLFQPLLYQVATTTLSPAEIASPIRAVLARHDNTVVRMEDIVGIDVKRRVVTTDRGEVAYDRLIVATGAESHYFGHPEWEAFAPGLKSLRDARDIRQRVLRAFEEAETAEALARPGALAFVVVGGGPSGVEMAGAIAELARSALAGDFRHIDPTYAHVILVEAAPRLLGAFPEALAERARRDLVALGVEVRLGVAIEEIGDGFVRLGGARLDASAVVWTAGVRATPIGATLGAPCDRAGRVLVGPDLTLPGHPEVHVIGDAAAAPDLRSTAQPPPSLPGLAAVAAQQGTYCARAIRAALDGKPPEPFRYKDLGTLATIGRNRAVAVFGRVRLQGFLAWASWAFVHILLLIGFRNRIVVGVQWLFAYIANQRAARLITD